MRRGRGEPEGRYRGSRAGWNAGGGRQSEARSVRPGWVNPGDGVGEPPPRDRDFRRRFWYFESGMLSQAGGDEIGPDPIPAR